MFSFVFTIYQFDIIYCYIISILKITINKIRIVYSSLNQTSCVCCFIYVCVNVLITLFFYVIIKIWDLPN